MDEFATGTAEGASPLALLVCACGVGAGLCVALVVLLQVTQPPQHAGFDPGRNILQMLLVLLATGTLLVGGLAGTSGLLGRRVRSRLVGALAVLELLVGLGFATLLTWAFLVTYEAYRSV